MRIFLQSHTRFAQYEVRIYDYNSPFLCRREYELYRMVLDDFSSLLAKHESPFICKPTNRSLFQLTFRNSRLHLHTFATTIRTTIATRLPSCAINTSRRRKAHFGNFARMQGSWLECSRRSKWRRTAHIMIA